MDCMRRIKRQLIKQELKNLTSSIMSAEEGSEAQLELQEEYLKRNQYLLSLERDDIFVDET